MFKIDHAYFVVLDYQDGECTMFFFVSDYVRIDWFLEKPVLGEAFQSVQITPISLWFLDDISIGNRV